ncbi:MAG: BACON domain-containing carbohydrate-binding protein [Blastocatellia bacterium]
MCLTWVTLSGASSGSGTSTINFTVATNTGAARNVALSIAGQTFTITQDAAAATCSAQRTLPAGYFPSQAATISVQATPGAGAQIVCAGRNAADGLDDCEH